MNGEDPQDSQSYIQGFNDARNQKSALAGRERANNSEVYDRGYADGEKEDGI